MPIALTLNETFEYQLIEDRLPDPVPEDAPPGTVGQRTESSKTDPNGTFFKLGPLTPSDEAEIGNAFFSYNSAGSLESVNHGTAAFERLMRGLRGWRNFRDKAGAEVEFKATRHEDNLARLTLAHRGELVQAHRRHYSVSETEGN